jgi:hypothetical protein
VMRVISVLVAVTAIAAMLIACGRASPPDAPPLHQVGQIPLPGDGSRLTTPASMPAAGCCSSPTLAPVR